MYTKRLFQLLKEYKLFLFISLIAALLFVGGRMGVSLFIGEFISEAFINNNENYQFNWKPVIILFGFGFLWSAAQYLMYLFSGKLAIRVAHSLRRDLYGKLVKLPIDYFHKKSSSEIISVAANDVTLIETFLMNVMVQLIAQPLTVVTIVSAMFIMNWKFSLYFLVLGPTIILLLGLIGNKVQQLGKSMQENVAQITKIFSESIRHITVIKGFNSEGTEISRFNNSNGQQLNLADKEIKIRLLALPMSDFLGITAIILILSLGAFGIQAGIATKEDVTKFVAMAIILSEPISSFNQLILVVRKIGPSAERIFKIIDSTPEQIDEKPSIGEIEGNITLKNVSFQYDTQAHALNGIDLDIKAGETIALVGASGSGKSTLMSLIPKFYTPQKGEIFIDGKNTTDYCASSIRQNIAIVTQDTSLFSDTILNNITLSKPNASMDEIIAATRIAHAYAFITEHPEGFDRHVGDNGHNLSGGERQRIILARAILREPAILLLDEPTSALDNNSEKHITAALENIYGKQTTIIIAHKLSTIEKADRIAVMEHGKILGIGTHAELMQNNSYYKKLYLASELA
ncbi:MAG: ABC transporter ATP-binding protein [Brevinema sp.]